MARRKNGRRLRRSVRIPAILVRSSRAAARAESRVSCGQRRLLPRASRPRTRFLVAFIVSHSSSSAAIPFGPLPFISSPLHWRSSSSLFSLSYAFYPHSHPSSLVSLLRDIRHSDRKSCSRLCCKHSLSSLSAARRPLPRLRRRRRLCLSSPSLSPQQQAAGRSILVIATKRTAVRLGTERTIFF